MADETAMPVLSVCTTVGSNLSTVPVNDGQLTFVRDKHKIALDYDGKRTVYTLIEELATEGARTSLLAPVTGLYYFVIETSVLWTYQDGWVQITLPPDECTNAINEALETAKTSGDFDGTDGVGITSITIEEV